MRYAAALLGALCALALATGSAPGADATSLADGLTALDAQLAGKASLTASQRASVHRDKAQLIAASFTQPVAGVTYADVLTALDCVDTDVQRARGTARTAALRLVGQAKGCQRALAAKLSAGGQASPGALADVATIGARIDAIGGAVRAAKVYGAKATALRRFAAHVVATRFAGTPVGGLRFAEDFNDLECIDVKVEAHRVSGASACARRLARLLRGGTGGTGGTTTTPKAPITWGSDLAGDPVAIRGTYQDDTEFWTQGVTVPVPGLVTQFRLKIGSDPEDLPLRFSVVRPQPDGTVKVVTTTNPPYTLPGGKPGTYTFDTSALSFACCKVQAGDIVTADNRGTGTPDPYVWFAARSGFTTFSHTSGGLSQNPGMVWTGTPHDGYELLLQVVEQPS